MFVTIAHSNAKASFNHYGREGFDVRPPQEFASHIFFCTNRVPFAPNPPFFLGNNYESN